MQAFNYLGILASWTGIILIAWLLVKERGIRDKDLSDVCASISTSLLVIWVIGMLAFLWTPTGLHLLVIIENLNFIVLIPVLIMAVDVMIQIRRLRRTS